MSRDWTKILWRDQTWGERAQNVIAWTFAWVIGLAMLVGVLLVLGMMMDANDHHYIEYDYCMKHATNGYNIQKCR
jgi:hypothetical protein